jgi:hypothetical protein
MSSDDRFEATFRLRLGAAEAWARLVGGDEVVRAGGSVWLPGFDARATVVEADAPHRLRATKDDEPCAGTDILVTLTDEGSGSCIRVVQSRFGDWLPALYEPMSVGWRFIVADLHTYLATGAHPGRHLRPWGDLGASASADDGGVRVTAVAPGGLADRLGLVDGDLLVDLGGAPVAAFDDVVTVLRSHLDGAEPTTAAWIRDGELLSVGG